MATPRAVLVAAGLVLVATGCGQSGEPRSSATPSAITVSPTGGAGPSPASPSSPADSTATTPPASEDPTPGESATGDPSDAGRTFTAADDGATVRLRVGEEAELLQQDPQSPDPVVTGDAVELVEVVNIQASGRRQWALRAVAPGTAELEATDGDTDFHLTIEVS